MKALLRMKKSVRDERHCRLWCKGLPSYDIPLFVSVMERKRDQPLRISSLLLRANWIDSHVSVVNL